MRRNLKRVALVGARWFTILAARRYRRGTPCLVLAPHADDETLGCGGTISAMRAAGLDVTVAFATDGAGSDRLGREHDTVVTTRRAEALAATRTLGLVETDVVFMGFPDGELCERLDDLSVALQRLIDEVNPAQILVCSSIDRHPDHVALRVACAGTQHQAAVVEYLVWAWPSWPISALTASKKRGASFPSLAREFVRLLPQLRSSNIAHHRKTKWRAIASYQSQIGDGTEGRGLPAHVLDSFNGRYELFVQQASETNGALGQRDRRPK